MVLTAEQITKINQKCSEYEQGVFIEPFGIPNNIKELVIYTKWQSSVRGGSCYDDDEHTVNTRYDDSRPDDAFKVLDLVLEELKVNTSIHQFRKIDGLVNSNTNIDHGYYGAYTEDTIEWILLSDLYEVLL